MSFTEQLLALPTERLKEIVRKRAFQIRSVPKIASKRDLCAWLAQTLSDAYAVRRAFDETTVPEARLLTYVVAQSGVPSRTILLQGLSEGADERLDQAAEGLESLGLAIRQPDSEGWRLWIPDAVRRNTPLPLPARHKLQPTLERYNTESLYRIVQQLGITTTGLTTKAARAAAITRTLLNDDVRQHVIELLSDEARKILDFVTRRGGVTSLHELGLRLDTRRRNQLYSYDWSYRWHAGAPRNPVEELLGAGLLVMEGDVGFHYGAILIPGDLLEKLTGENVVSASLPAQPEWQVLPAEGQPVRTHHSLTRDIAYLLAYLTRSPTGRTGKGIIHRTALKTIAKSLTIPTIAYATLIYALCREAGLIDTVERDGSYGVTSDGEVWLETRHEDQIRALFNTWQSQRLWVEPAPDLLMEDGQYLESSAVRSVRQTVIDLFAEFFRQYPADLVAVRSLVERARYRRWAYFAPDDEDAGGESSDKDGVVTGSELVSRILLALYGLGLLEGITSTSGDLVAVRLNVMGRSILLGEPYPETADEVQQFVVQPNLEIYAPPNLTPKLYFGLFRIADPKGTGMLEISRESLRKAMDREMTSGSILDFLRQHSSTGLPQNVEYLVREVGGKHGHIRVGNAGLYLVVDDPILLKELAAQKKLSIQIRKQLADTVALVTGDSVDAVLKQLRLAGYFPIADKTGTTRGSKRSTNRSQGAAAGMDSSSAVIAAIDWDRLTEEKSRSTSARNTTAGATDVREIRRLIEQAIADRKRLEYSAFPDPLPGQIVKVEPVGLAGSLLRVFVYTRGYFGIINLAQMRWARLTDESFEPKPEPANLAAAGG